MFGSSFSRFTFARLARAGLRRGREALMASCLVAGLLLASCASGPSQSNPVTSPTGPDATPTELSFTLRVNPNGQIDSSGQGYYIILFNAMGEPIEVTDVDTFTDFLRYDGHNLDWYHRQANLPNPGFSFNLAGNLNSAIRLPDAQTLIIVLDTSDPDNLLNQFIASSTFSLQAITTDNLGGAFIGRVLDTMGQGPSIDGNSLQTLTVNKSLGAQSPLPQFYPDDALNDWVTQDLPGEFPFPNFDLARFEVNIL